MDVPVNPPPITATGPILIGVILNWYLYGVLCVQYLLYLLHTHDDKKLMKFIVHLIFLLDTVQSILAMNDAFFRFGYNFGDLDKVYDYHLASIDIPALDAVIALIVQVVYCWRIWVLSQWILVPCLTMLIALLSAACGLAVGILNFELGTFQRLIQIWVFASALTDITIASSMTYILLKFKRESSGVNKRLGRRIMRLLTLTLETNAVTAAVAIETIIVLFIKSIAPPATNIYEPAGFVLGKLYSNCFMVLLNQRHHHTTGNSELASSAVITSTSLGFSTTGHSHERLPMPPLPLPLRLERSETLTENKAASSGIVFAESSVCQKGQKGTESSES